MRGVGGLASPGGVGLPGPILLLHDLEQDLRREIEVPRPDQPIGFGTVDVQLASDGGAVLVSFRDPEQGDQVQTLLIELLDGEPPRLRWVDTDRHVVFDAPVDERGS